MSDIEADATNRAVFSVQIIALIVKGLGDGERLLTLAWWSGWARSWRERTRRSKALCMMPVGSGRVMNRRNLLTAAAASVMLPGGVMAKRGAVTAMPLVHPDADLLARLRRVSPHPEGVRGALHSAPQRDETMIQPRPSWIL